MRKAIFVALALAACLTVPPSAASGGSGGGRAPGSVAVASPNESPGLTHFTTADVTGGYIAAGTGLRNRGYGTINLTGLPEGAIVESAYLYWTILADDPEPEFRSLKLDGTPVTGGLIGVVAQSCWLGTASFSYRADVTAIVDTAGDYSITDVASGLTDASDPWFTVGPPPYAQGASVVAVYSAAGTSMTLTCPPEN